jgi:hypothetical protein
MEIKGEKEKKRVVCVKPKINLEHTLYLEGREAETN